jgi:hypothetical protein
MKNNLCIAFVLPALFVCGLACGSAERARSDTKKLRAATSPKILVQPEPKGKTGVYQQDFRILPELLVDGKIVPSGEHEFTLFSSGNYSGKKPSCDVKSLALSLSHVTNRDDGWKFPPSAAASVIVDGTPMVLNVHSQLPYKLPSMANYMKDPQASEALIITPTCEMYQRISKAQTLEFRIGNAGFALSSENVASFREFAQAIGYSK